MDAVKLFVDDIRACPSGWHPARTVTEAIRVLATIPVKEISLDHDIQCCGSYDSAHHASEENFEPVARYIALMLETGAKLRVWIHTSNYTAGAKMAEIIGIEYGRVIYDPKAYGESGPGN